MNSAFPFLPKFLRLNQYSISTEEIALEVASHPDYPSLFSITDTLTKLGVENAAFRIEKDQFKELPNSFIAVLDNTNRKDLSIVLVQKKDEKVRIEFENNTKKKLAINEFLEQWNGIVVAVEPNEVIQYKTNWSSKVVTASLLVLMGLISVSILHSWIPIACYILFSVGSYISYLIVQESIGILNLSVAKVCNVNSKTSCSAVLSSKGSKLFGFLELADASLIYFFSLLLSMVLLSLFGNSFKELFYAVILSILILPYTVYYQWKIVKKWCILCLALSGVILLTLIPAFFYFQNVSWQTPMDYRNILVLLIIILFVSLLWLELKKYWKQSFNLKQIQVDYYKLKRNPELFKSALQQSAPLKMQGYYPILLGEQDSVEKITLALSPSCGHCFKAFKDVKKLQKVNPNIGVEILFNANMNNEANFYNKVAQRIMELYLKNGKCGDEICDWFVGEMPLEIWLKKWGESQSGRAKQLILEHFDWCAKNGINYTPATIYRSYKLPSYYKLEDLQFLINN